MTSTGPARMSEAMARPAASRPREREASLPAERRFSLDDRHGERSAAGHAAGGESRPTGAAAVRERRAETRAAQRTAAHAAQARDAARRQTADDRTTAQAADKAPASPREAVEAARPGSGAEEADGPKKADAAGKAPEDEDDEEDAVAGPPPADPAAMRSQPTVPAAAGTGAGDAPENAVPLSGTGRTGAAAAETMQRAVADAEAGPEGTGSAGFVLPQGGPDPSSLMPAETKAGSGSAAGAPTQPAPAQRSDAPATTPPTPLSAVPMTIGLRALADSNRFEIRLDPAHLGRVSVSLDIDREHGAVKAHLVVERPETLALLQRDARSLEQALNQAGLSAGEAALSFSLGDGSAGSQGGMSRDDDGHRSGPRPSRPDVEPVPVAALGRVGVRSGLDLVI
ncbi:MAG: flagellar hook-length control protein FliK [Methylobacterium frigidaeris]